MREKLEDSNLIMNKTIFPRDFITRLCPQESEIAVKRSLVDVSKRST